MDNKKKSIVKLAVKIGSWILVIAFLGGFAGVVAERFFLPWLSSLESLRGIKMLQKANERVTVIEKTEQVTVKEDFSVTKTAQGVLPAVVSIVTYNDEKQPETAVAKANINAMTTANAGDSALKIQSSQDIQNYVKTGLILTSDGLIMSVLTNEKELSETQTDWKFKIMAADGREFDAKIKAIDPYSNLVFFKADFSNMSVPTLGDSDKLESGEKIIVAGNTVGEYQNNFSLGIIREKDLTFSLLNSELSSSDLMEGAIISDAQIDYKNIGGPVIDFSGTVVGLANQIEKDGKKFGFIVPINSIRPSIDRIINSPEFKRPQLGVYYLSINREIALLNNLPVNQGALVYSFSGQQGLAVIKNSAADLAGIKIGDVVTGVNDAKIDLSHSLSSLIAQFQPGDEVTLKVLRAGKELEINAKLN